eukprot:TRINITY_DN10268_c0_g4_i5.p2 TRINITY_DN10268_c0_g4~~TRINITY_DN10268_c0_g4_i5.p2  ORF type:complete len:117 (-),score=15.01 TRINITY_DN10268_c0_g4_i5:119-469(-)
MDDLFRFLRRTTGPIRLLITEAIQQIIKNIEDAINPIRSTTAVAMERMAKAIMAFRMTKSLRKRALMKAESEVLECDLLQIHIEGLANSLSAPLVFGNIRTNSLAITFPRSTKNMK